MSSDEPLVQPDVAEAIDRNRMSIDNEGNAYVNNRATRRRKPLKARRQIIDYFDVPENINTKPSHKYKKIRSEHARTKEQRKRDAARARKARKEGYSEES